MSEWSPLPNAWSDLPNARHIDRVLVSIKNSPAIWGKAGQIIHGEGNFNPDWVQAWSDTGRVILDQVGRTEAKHSAQWAAERAIGPHNQYGVIRAAAWDAILALIAYDDCVHYLELSSDKLLFIADLSGQPAPRLLLSAVRAFEQESKAIQKHLLDRKYPM